MACDIWATPPALFRAIDKEFNFDLDVCAEESTAKCAKYWTIEDDALKQDWVAASSSYIWCNPPYSNPLPFVNHAVTTQLMGRGTVMLMNHDMSNEWGAFLVPFVSEIRVFIASGSKKDRTYRNGRVRFLKNGVEQKDNPKGQALFIFDPHRIGECKTVYVPLSEYLKEGEI